MEPEEVAAAFDHKRARSRHLGCQSKIPWWWNCSKHQLSNNHSKVPVAVECRLLYLALKPVFMSTWKGQQYWDGSVFEYCQLNRYIQAWSVLQHGYFKGILLGKEEFAARNHVLNDEKYQVLRQPIALAWVLRYPGKMQALSSERPNPSISLKRGKQQQSTTRRNGTKSTWLQ